MVVVEKEQNTPRLIYLISWQSPFLRSLHAWLLSPVEVGFVEHLDAAVAGVGAEEVPDAFEEGVVIGRSLEGYVGGGEEAAEEGHAIEGVGPVEGSGVGFGEDGADGGYGFGRIVVDVAVGGAEVMEEGFEAFHER